MDSSNRVAKYYFLEIYDHIYLIYLVFNLFGI